MSNKQIQDDIIEICEEFENIAEEATGAILVVFNKEGNTSMNYTGSKAHLAIAIASLQAEYNRMYFGDELN